MPTRIAHLAAVQNSVRLSARLNQKKKSKYEWVTFPKLTVLSQISTRSLHAKVKLNDSQTSKVAHP